MKFIEIPFNNAYKLVPETFEDDRGWFMRVFCKAELNKISHTKEIVQINHSYTGKKGSIRGMHFQEFPKAEIKIVKCLSGSIFDVMIDLRKGSTTFLKWYGDILSAENKHMMYIPEGFAHGFQTLKPDCEILYLHTEFYSPEYEKAIRYDDPKISIAWPEEVTDISERDKSHPHLTDDFEGLII